MKRCTKCGVEQPLDNFYKAQGTRDGLRGDCKLCFKARAKERYPLVRDKAIARAKQWRIDNIERHREVQRARRTRPEVKARDRAGHLKRKFGITLETYDELLTKQHGVYAICGRSPRDDISLHVDHEHGTGRVRGLLCFRCNNALGDFDDDPLRLLQALAYVSFQPEDAPLVRQRLRTVLIPAASR